MFVHTGLLPKSPLILSPVISCPVEELTQINELEMIFHGDCLCPVLLITVYFVIFQLHFKFFGICWPQQVVWYFTLSWHSRCWMEMNLVFAPGSGGISSERGCMDSEADIRFQFLCVTLKKSPSLTSTFLALRGMWCTR